MRALLIDPKTQTIAETTYTGDYKHIYTLIESSLFDVVRLGDKEENTIFVDDEGLINGKADPDVCGMFRVDGDNPAYLAGKGLMLATDSDGESVGTTMPLETLRERIAFGVVGRYGVRGGLYFFETGTDGTPTGRHWPINN